MRALGIGLGLLASAQLVCFSSPAFAQGNDGKPDTQTDAPKKDATAGDASKGDAKDTAKDDAKPAPTADGTVEVHVESPTAVSLEKRDGELMPWEHVCVSPCEGESIAHNAQRVPVSAQYRIVGPDLNPSKPFMLDASKGKVELVVSPGYNKKGTAGVYVLGAGGVLTVGGIVMIIAGTGTGSAFPADGTTSNKNQNFVFAGTALIIAGVSAGILGGAWVVDNLHTKVDGNVAGAKGNAGEKVQPVQLNVDKDVKRETGPTPNVQALSVPLLQGTF